MLKVRQFMETLAWRHWKIAECSESAGIISTPYSLRRGSTAGPPAIRVSLFASAMVFFFLIASTVGSSPAHPTIPSKNYMEPGEVNALMFIAAACVAVHHP